MSPIAKLMSSKIDLSFFEYIFVGENGPRGVANETRLALSKRNIAGITIQGLFLLLREN